MTHTELVHYFQDNQKDILSFVNTEAGRYLLSTLGREVEYPIYKVMPNCFIEDTGERKNGARVLRGRFWTRDFISDLFLPLYEKLLLSQSYTSVDDPYDALLFYSGLENSNKYPHIYLTTNTFNSNAGGDGNVYIDNGGTWATVRGAASGTAQGSVDPINVYASQLTSVSIGRMFLPTDTSGIGSGSTITAGSNTWGLTVTQVFGLSGTIDICQTAQASNTSLANGDYSTVTFTDVGDIAVSTTGLKTITINTTGETYINKTGFSKFGCLENHDITNVDPSPNDFRFGVNTSDNGTPANRPVLTVVYTLPPGSALFTGF